MIERYQIKEIEAIWSDQNRFSLFLLVEKIHLQSLEQWQKIPQGCAAHLDQVHIKLDRIAQIEQQTRHDFLAFLESISEQMPAGSARYLHYGLTSSDVIDTATMMMIRDSLQIVISDLQNLIEQFIKLEKRDEQLMSVGRSHGRVAEPMSWGRKWSSFRAELQRRLSDYQQILASEITGQFSGAVGNYTFVDAEIEKMNCQKLNLRPEDVSTQIIPRDRIAKIITQGALMAAALERMAVDLRLLQHSGVDEAFEGFAKGQKGSSVMPHKKNPVSAENISGLARYLRSQLSVSLENIVLWHERDISHSSAERLYLPDHFSLCVYLLRRSFHLVQNLVIDSNRCEELYQQAKENFSSFYLHQLIDQTDLSREQAYELVQKATFSKGHLEQRIKDLLKQRHD